ncbi:hypothetical protein DLS47_12935 [Staphylococcus pseudintermedius]|nr:hypothetical protein DLS47_12935 [Staphylococcus pseudintermedius]
MGVVLRGGDEAWVENGLGEWACECVRCGCGSWVGVWFVVVVGGVWLVFGAVCLVWDCWVVLLMFFFFIVLCFLLWLYWL